MNIVFRLDSSEIIGTGHLMRCLSLANSLKEAGAKCFFVCRDHIGNINEIIKDSSHEAIILPIKNNNSAHKIRSMPLNYEDWLGTTWEIDADETINSIKEILPDWIIIDHYGIDTKWEKLVRPYCRGIFVIDDLANRRHDCDIFLDQNLHTLGESAYQDLLPLHCTKLLGPKNILIKDDFLSIKPPHTPNELKHLFVYFGSYDIYNQAGNALSAINALPELTADIVLGKNHPHKEKLVRSSTKRVEVIEHLDNLGQYMTKADLSLGSCGVTAWERCALGLPTITCTTADNQKENAECLHRYGAIISLGNSAKVTREVWLKEINNLRKDTNTLKMMKIKSLELVSGYHENKVRLISKLMNNTYH